MKENQIAVISAAVKKTLYFVVEVISYKKSYGNFLGATPMMNRTKK